MGRLKDTFIYLFFSRILIIVFVWTIEHDIIVQSIPVNILRLVRKRRRPKNINLKTRKYLTLSISSVSQHHPAIVRVL